MLVQIAEPFDFDLSVERIAALGADRVNALDGGRLWRAVGGRAIAAAPAPGGVSIHPADDTGAAVFAHILGGSLDLAGFVQAVGEDVALGPLIRALPGLRPFLVPDSFEMLVTSITAQQISLRAALAVRNRFVERLGARCGPVYAFPSPARVAESGQDELRELGFSRSKARFVLEIARADFDYTRLAALGDEAVVEALTALPGVGRWTAEWFLSRKLGRPDVWPAGDLGVRRACERFLTGGEPVDEARARRLGEQFAPRRTLACAYLLAGLRRSG